MLNTLYWISSAAIVHHHLTYPLSLKPCKTRLQPNSKNGELPSVTVIIPAYQEESVITAKVKNLSAIAYPSGKLYVEIHCDGCTDNTAGVAIQAIEKYNENHSILVIAHDSNRGKITVLNEAIGGNSRDLIVLTDASAAFEPDAIGKLVRHFANPIIAAAGGIYNCNDNGSEGEKRYWHFQNQLRQAEASMDSAMGLSGALYAFRRSLFTPLEMNTINDDFLLPMKMVANGYRVVLDPEVVVTEMERTAPGQDFARRQRIGAGNFQQTIRLMRLANLARPKLAYCFVSGKAFRSVMPILMLVALITNIFLTDSEPIYKFTFAAQLVLYMVAFIGMLFPPEFRFTPFSQLATLVSGHIASGLGIVKYISGDFSNKWQRTNSGESTDLYGSTPVRIAKRLSDQILGLILLIVFIIAFVPIAVAIKLDSRGPIFYRQQRVGRQLANRTDLFHLIKFRTMSIDAEINGATWATKTDSRVTRVGNFMRKTRLDELPQAINVLRGEMSMIGPRPERPQFFSKLEGTIPLYSERTYSVLPGITGLAQVKQGYDETVEDVRSKVGWDHAYAARIDTFWSWLKTDFSIACETVVVMIRGRGQ